MPLPDHLFSLCRNLLRRSRVEHDLDLEVRAYVDLVTDEKVEAGMSRDAARRAALLEAGGIEQIKEEVREVRRGRMLEDLIQDLRFGFRALRKNPSFAIVAVLALALGIGANTAMFSVAYGILLRPLPYPDAGRVATVYMHFYPQNFERGNQSVADFLDWKAGNHTFEEPAAWNVRRIDLAGPGEPEPVQGSNVTAGFFPTLRVRPLLGRVFLAGGDSPNGPREVVLSESLWRRRFGGSNAALGQVIQVDGAPATVVGVMPSTFRFPQETTQLWVNLRFAPPARRGPFLYKGIARLKPGVSLAQAQVETNAIGRRIMRENPMYKNLTMPVVGLRDTLLGSVKTAVWVLMGATGLVLLIAVVNVANLMLARATVRQREMALRLSLGAGRGRLIRQLLTESVLLAAAGGAAGLAVAYGGVQLLRSWNPGNLPLIEFVRLDSGALAFLLAISLLTGILFGIAPAFESSRANLNATLKEGGRGASSSRSRPRTRGVLVITEVALSLMLLVGAGLLFKSLILLQHVNGGFDALPKQILSMDVSVTDRKYDAPEALTAYYDQILASVRALPGVESAGIGDSLPPGRLNDADTFTIEGQVLKAGELNPAVPDLTISPGFFRTLGIPLLDGRDFNEHDRQNSAPVAIISESLARRYFDGRNPLGHHLKESGTDNQVPYREIVGVAGDVKYMGFDKGLDPAYYMPHSQNAVSYTRRTNLVVRSAGGIGGMAQALRRAVQSVDRSVSLSTISTMQAALDSSFAQPRFDTLLLALFAIVALLLAAVGIYGLMAYSVVQRTHEIGVRMALGAGRADVLSMVVRQGARLALLGIGVGLIGAWSLTRLLTTLLFGVSATDPLTFAIVALGLLAVALLAAVIPALRATRISPVIALRYE